MDQLPATHTPNPEQKSLVAKFALAVGSFFVGPLSIDNVRKISTAAYQRQHYGVPNSITQRQLFIYKQTDGSWLPIEYYRRIAARDNNRYRDSQDVRHDPLPTIDSALDFAEKWERMAFADMPFWGHPENPAEFGAGLPRHHWSKIRALLLRKRGLPNQGRMNAQAPKLRIDRSLQ